ncbi:MAG: sugar transferase [Bacteroidales bacterium]|nr:sugar transferase [Bacteroidales bacterium]
MEIYLHQVHNLTSNSRFAKLPSVTRSAIVSIFTDSLRDLNELEKIIRLESSQDVLDYIKQYLRIPERNTGIIFTTRLKSYVENVDFDNLNAIINFKKANNIRNIDGLFKAVNSLLPIGGIYVGRVETYGNRKDSIYKKYNRFLRQLIWLCDFALNRIIPRIPYLDSLYYFITNGEFHAISKPETMGRLIYCGFDIVDFQIINGLSYFVARKVKNPNDSKNPSFYPIIRLRRIGMHGKMISVYKFRTMHPYSEFLQDYLVKHNGYNDKGKPANDYRITRWGKFLRCLWLDELPQLINIMKGEMKLVGLRPLSRARFNEFPTDLQRKRILYKPGCIPPYVALNMPDDKGNIEAERIYIRDLTEHPYLTDLRYLLKAVYNILTNKIRSS